MPRKQAKSVDLPTPRRAPAAPRPQRAEGESLAAEILRSLEERGVPGGAWLVDIARARHALQEADGLLRRLEDAIVRSASSSPLDAS